MSTYDYSFLNNGLLPAKLLNLTSYICSLNTVTNIRKGEYAEIFTKLEAVTRVQSVKSSNATEGIVAEDERIVAIVNGNDEPLNYNEAAIAGYRDALEEIHLGYQRLDFCESDILQLHRRMMSVEGYEYAGQYKTEDNVILLDGVGRRRGRICPVPAAETKQEMERLVFGYMAAKGDANINQLLLIPCVIFDFLRIYPFRDGSGRMARLLSLLLLYKNGYDVGKYVSFEEQINHRKSWNDELIGKAPVSRAAMGSAYFPFMENFLSSLYLCYKELDKLFAVISGKKFTKKARIEAAVLNSPRPLSKAEVCSALPDVSLTTVEAVLGAMVKEGTISRIGQGRSTRYMRSSD